MSGWIGVDLDGTLAHYTGWKNSGAIGAPVPEMVRQVLLWLRQGREVRIFTARVWTDGTTKRNCMATAQRQRIEQWCREYLGQVLPVTCEKDPEMVELWDDRAVHVIFNQGVPCCQRGAADAERQ